MAKTKARKTTLDDLLKLTKKIDLSLTRMNRHLSFIGHLLKPKPKQRLTLRFTKPVEREGELPSEAETELE